MSWGCYKHEMDADSEHWKAAVAKATPPPYESWGRHEEVCPECWMELKRERDLLKALLSQQLGAEITLCSDCSGVGKILREQWWPPGTEELEECEACLGVGLQSSRGQVLSVGRLLDGEEVQVEPRWHGRRPVGP